MGKDREGTFHPGKGKPSGENKEEGLGIQHTPPEKMDQYDELTEKYTEGEDEIAQSAKMRKPNRNTSKKEKVVNKPAAPKQAMEPEQVTPMEEIPSDLTRRRFAELAVYESDPCISIYLDTVKAREETQQFQARIRFKNHLQELVELLRQRDVEEDRITAILAPGHALTKNDEFWINMEEGLAIFMADDVFYTMKTKLSPMEDRLIDSTFYVAPLLPMIKEDVYFYILVLNKKKCKLYKADSSGIQPVAVKLPDSMEDVKGIPERESGTFRMGEGTFHGAANFHGTGGGNPDDKTNQAVYFEYVDDILRKEVFSKEDKAPLLLAGVEYQIPIYRSVADYKNIWPEALTGARDQQNEKDLYNDAMELMRPIFAQKLERALEEYGNKSATLLTTTVTGAIIADSYYSRIATLFVRKGEHLFGSFDEQENRLELNHHPDEGGEDLIDNAVVNTLAKGGEVFLLDKEEMPEEAVMAAILRY